MLNIDAPKDFEIIFEVIGGTKGPILIPTNDRRVVARIEDTDQSIKITVKRDSDQAVFIYSLENLVLEESLMIVLDVDAFTGTKETSVIVSGTEYDANNVSANRDTAKHGTLIVNRLEQNQNGEIL